MNARRSQAWFAPFALAAMLVGSAMAAQNRPGHLGLPPVPAATLPANDGQTALGQALFFDTRLSKDGKVSCATCHQPARAFSDGIALAQGVGGQFGTRNTPSLLNVTFNTSQFWDGRRETLEMQAPDPFLNPREHGLSDTTQILTRISSNPNYAPLFQSAFGHDARQGTMAEVSAALSAFQRTLLAAGSAFDRYQYGNDPSALNASELRGLKLFTGTARCSACHTIAADAALFSDNGFHSLGVGMGPISRRLAAITSRLVQANNVGAVLDQSILNDAEIAELGRFALTLQPVDIGKFRTPSLRNVALTAPYMHDGSVATLAEAVELEIYYRSVEGGRPMILTPGEKADLVAFLGALNGVPPRMAPPAPGFAGGR